MAKTAAIVGSAYFAPVQWYQKLRRCDDVWIEAMDHYGKQTYRNRCIIATTNGIQALTVPVMSHDPDTLMRDIRVSDHGQWRHLHWQAMTSAYGESPFFEYYADDLHALIHQPWQFLYDMNMAITEQMCEWLDIHPSLHITSEYKAQPEMPDYREVIRPKHAPHDPLFTPQPYYQVYGAKHGFLPNLSILDLLCNMGNESIFYL